MKIEYKLIKDLIFSKPADPFQAHFEGGDSEKPRIEGEVICSILEPALRTRLETFQFSRNSRDCLGDLMEQHGGTWIDSAVNYIRQNSDVFLILLACGFVGMDFYKAIQTQKILNEARERTETEAQTTPKAEPKDGKIPVVIPFEVPQDGTDGFNVQ